MVSTEKAVTGRVLRIQRLSTEDGPGIRSTVFLKGCGLGCTWCHNPESLSFRSEVQWIGAGCLGCGICAEACPEGALTLAGGRVAIDRSRCTGCGACVRECPTGAMEILGEEWSPRELVEELAKDRSYFENGGGGITVSGGEALLQAPFTVETLQLAKEKGIATAVDTCGFVPWDSLEAVLPWTDLILYDLKLMDRSEHFLYTGADNRGILDNLKKAARVLKETGSPRALWIRTPLIPGVTDREENITAIGAFLAEHLPGCADRWELCAFNNLCRDKYTRLGKTWDFETAPLLTKDEMEQAAATARRAVDRPEIVCWTGTVRDEKRRD